MRPTRPALHVFLRYFTHSMSQRNHAAGKHFFGNLAKRARTVASLPISLKILNKVCKVKPLKGKTANEGVHSLDSSFGNLAGIFSF